MKDKCDTDWTQEQMKIREFSPTYYMSIQNLKRVLKKLNGRVLEIGCGGCTITQHIIKGDVDYIGTDHSDITVKAAKERGYVVYKKSATNFNFKQKFDFILSIQMLEHVKDDEKVIQQCWNNLKTGGQLILSTDTNPKLFGPLDVQAGHFRRYDPDALVRMIERNGFIIKKVYHTGFPMCRVYRRLQFLLGKKQNRDETKKYKKYIPEGKSLNVAMKILPFVLPLFKIDNLFSSKYFRKYSRGILIIAYKA